MNIFLDCETSGLPKRELSWQTNWRQFPRIVSIAWLVNSELVPDREEYYILNQIGKPIPPAATAVHGITDEMCWQSVHFPKEVFKKFIADALEADHIIGHNTYFDTSILKANVIREFGEDSQEIKDAIAALDKTKRIDIMRKGAKHFGGWKTLVLQYEQLFGEGFRSHHALADAKAAKRVYEKLREMKIL